MDRYLDNPEQFWLYNNSITIVCDDFKEENFAIKILTPQIVNGCQTAQSIWQVLSKKQKAEAEAIQGNVLVRIIKNADAAQRENITRYTNSQNAVRGKDFFALEEFHKKLQRRFQKLGYYYEIQRGAFASLKKSERNAYMGIPELSYLVDNTKFKGVVPTLDSAQAYTAGFKQQPAIAYGVPYELAPDGAWYDKVFEKSLKPEPKLFLYPYLVREWARKNGYSRGSEGGWRAHSSLFFVYTYYVLIVEVLRKLELIDSLESSPDNIPLNVWEKVFFAGHLNEQLLNIMDQDILDRFFTDSKVTDAIGLDVRKFLKNQDNTGRYRPILVHHIHSVVFSARHRNLIEELKIGLAE
jgi:hypothetical protein